jgi:hypothetical protein
LVSTSAPLAGLTTPLGPRVSPVGALRIGGRSAWDNPTGVGPAPEVSWEAPTIGTPSVYLIEINRLGPPGQEGSTRVALIETTATHVTIPPDLLQAGAYHYLTVFALDGVDPARPYRYRYPNGLAMTLSGYFTP